MLVNHRNSFSIDINYLHWDTIPINQLMDSLVVHILREITSPRSATVVSLSQLNNRNGLVLNYRVRG